MSCNNSFSFCSSLLYLHLPGNTISLYNAFPNINFTKLRLKQYIKHIQCYNQFLKKPKVTSQTLTPLRASIQKKKKAEERQFKNLTDMHRLCPKYCHISEGSDAIIPYHIYLLNSFWVCVHTCALFLNTRI